MTKMKHRMVKDLVSGKCLNTNKETSTTAFFICIIFIRFVGAAKGPPLLSSDYARKPVSGGRGVGQIEYSSCYGNYLSEAEIKYLHQLPG